MLESESMKLTSRFVDMEREGLVDVKFLLRNTPDATTEIVCGEVNAVLDAFSRGETVPFAFNDSQKQ